MKAFALLLVLAVSLGSPAFAQQGNPGETRGPTRGLKTGHLKAIQGISRSVLAAKHSEEENPDLRKLRQGVRKMRRAVREVYRLTLSAHKGSVTILEQPGSGASESQAVGTARMHPKREAAQRKLTEAVAKVRAHRLAMESKQAQASATRRRPVAANALAKVKELERECESIMDSPSHEQPGRLSALLERMAPRRLLSGAKREDQTPTISTRTRHRR